MTHSIPPPSPFHAPPATPAVSTSARPAVADAPRTLVVFSGGGMKGFAHIGVLRAIRRMNPNIVGLAGTSVGAFVAAMAAIGMSVDDMEALACNVRRKDVLDFDWTGLMLRRMRTPALHRGERIATLIHRTLGNRRYLDVETPLFVNAVDIAAGMNVIFGLPGLNEFLLWDTVTASCSIPGLFPPRKIRDRYFVDGAVTDNLQLRVAKVLPVDLVIAVNLQAFTVMDPAQVARSGFVELMGRGDAITSHELSEVNFAQPMDVPRILIHPDVSEFEVFGFKNNQQLIAEGERAAELALSRFQQLRSQERERERVAGRSGRVPLANGPIEVMPGEWSASAMAGAPRHEPAAAVTSVPALVSAAPERVGNPFVIDTEHCNRCGMCVANNPDGLFVSAGPGQPVYVDRAKVNTHDMAPLVECPFGAIRMDYDLLKQLFAGDPPEHLVKVALGHSPFGRPIFAPPIEESPSKRAAV